MGVMITALKTCLPYLFFGAVIVVWFLLEFYLSSYD
jgi:hypothetical protein